MLDNWQINVEILIMNSKLSLFSRIWTLKEAALILAGYLYVFAEMCRGSEGGGWLFIIAIALTAFFFPILALYAVCTVTYWIFDIKKMYKYSFIAYIGYTCLEAFIYGITAVTYIVSASSYELVATLFFGTEFIVFTAVNVIVLIQIFKALKIRKDSV